MKQIGKLQSDQIYIYFLTKMSIFMRQYRMVNLYSIDNN